MKAPKIVNQQVPVIEEVHARSAAEAIERLRTISAMVSVLLLADNDDMGLDALTAVERYDFLNQVRELADQAKEKTELLHDIVRRHFAANSQGAEAANG